VKCSLSHAGEKTAFERALIAVLNDAVSAGNIVLFFNNLPAFIRSAKTIGSDVISIMEPYFTSPNIQIVAIAHPNDYHDVLEQDPVVRQRFEMILLDKPGDDEITRVLERAAERLEAQSGVVFTYGSLGHIIRSVHQHFSDPVMPDKAVDLLIELPARVVRDHRVLVTKHDVDLLIEQKLGVPTQQINATERDTLLHMEDAIHERVIGQDEAVTAVSNAMRRSRAGVRDGNKPIGSFLFVGPTGVGKTETAKALAELFFGNEENMSRIDMSEFSGPRAVDRLIGSPEDGKIGVLSRVIKKRPYGVLLLDEFEKSASEVHDLFLQILDEGFFTDVRGSRVNARDTIFIATSNAASDLIFKRMKEGAQDASIKEEVVEHIIEHNIFKPELLNRFDAVVLFHPLELSHMQKIAALMLNKLQERLRAKGLKLEVTEELVAHVAKQGLDPIFGARPMNRYIQEHVEQAVAMKFIQGDIAAGSTLTLNVKDLEK
jgi:ATP-dependent Clp protease ATP-binding subunit ClpC